jgi:hypothetical protein
MKNPLRFLSFCCAGFLLLAASLACTEDARGGFAQPGDVVGYWQMIPMSAELTAKNVENPWPLPFQYFAIYANGEMFAHMSTHATDHTPASLDPLHAMLPKTVHSAFNADGFKVVTRGEVAGARPRAAGPETSASRP